MKKMFIVAVLVLFSFLASAFNGASLAQDKIPPLGWKSKKECCGEEECFPAKIRIGKWDQELKKFIVKINEDLIALSPNQVGYTNEGDSYCFMAGSEGCWRKIGRKKVPVVSQDCVICAIEQRKETASGADFVLPIRQILVRKISPGASTGANTVQRLRLLPVMPRDQCVFCHPPQKEIMKKWTETWFGRKLPEIFGFRPHP